MDSVISQPPQLSPESLDGSRTRGVVARAANGQRPTYRLSHLPARRAAYRRLALAVLGLDVVTLADELRAARRFAHVLPRAA